MEGNERFTYTYNYQQANFYIQKGVRILEVGLHRHTCKVWFKFDKEESYNAFIEWNSICH